MKWITMPPFLDESDQYRFPPVSAASIDGVVCYGGNLSPGALLSAYRQGIFPWPSTPGTLRWCSPDPRFIIPKGFLYITESARKVLNKALRRDSSYTLTLDKAFINVINNCATIPRPSQPGTWIFPNLVNAYSELHERGYAHSVEVWRNGILVGGLYGVSIGAAFFGESMFSIESNASKIGFLALAATLFDEGFEFVDCQVYTPYLELMGGVDIPRDLYLAMLQHALQKQTLKGDWSQYFKNFPEADRIIAAKRNTKINAHNA